MPCLTSRVKSILSKRFEENKRRTVKFAALNEHEETKPMDNEIKIGTRHTMS